MRSQETSEHISLAADSELAPEKMNELEERIETCDQCQRTRRALATVDALLANACMAEPPAGMANQVMQRIRAHKRRRARMLVWARRAMWLVIVAATTALLTIALTSTRTVLRTESTPYAGLVRNLVAFAQLGGTLAGGMRVIVSAFVEQINLAPLAMYVALALAVGAVWMRVIARGPWGSTRAKGN